MIPRPDIVPDAGTLAHRAAERITAVLDEAVRASGTATIALSGGATPRATYALLAAAPFAGGINWSAVQLFWCDERCVPPHSPESNYRMVRETLLEKIAMPAANIHRIEGELPPETAAARYEEEIRQAVPHEGKIPRFDLVLLGLGEDGHTASLFPGTPALEEDEMLVTSVYVERLKTYRVSMTLPLINNARNILFLVSGKGKANILRDVLASGGAPARLVQPVDGTLLWLVDSDAASFLEKAHPS